MTLVRIGDEQLGSRDATLGENPSASVSILYYSDDQTDTETDALDQGWTDAPSSVHSMPKVSRTVQSLGAWRFLVTVNYRPASNVIPSRPAAGDPTRTRVDATGVTQNIKRSIATVATQKVTGQPDASYDQLINVTDDGIEGVDVIVPSWREEITRYLDDSAYSSARSVIYGLIGKVNNATFKGFAAGEVLFLGATADQRPEDEVWEVTYRFEMRPNRTGITVGDLPAFDQKGWEFAWFRTAPADGGAGITRTPTHVFVEQVYETGDFSTLGV